jgi:hypothetical protein
MRRWVILYLEYQRVFPFVGSPPHSLPASELVSPLDPTGGEQHPLAGEGEGGSKSDERTESLAFCILCGGNSTVYVYV